MVVTWPVWERSRETEVSVRRSKVRVQFVGKSFVDDSPTLDSFRRPMESPNSPFSVSSPGPLVMSKGFPRVTYSFSEWSVCHRVEVQVSLNHQKEDEIFGRFLFVCGRDLLTLEVLKFSTDTRILCVRPEVILFFFFLGHDFLFFTDFNFPFSVIFVW